MSELDTISPVLSQDLIATDGVLYAIQSKVLQYCRALQAFQRIELMFIEDSKTIDDDISKALKDLGMSIMISIGAADDRANGVPGVLILDPLELIVTVFENPMLNRGDAGSGLTGNKACELAAVALKMRRVGDSFLSRPKLRLNNEEIGQTLAKTVTFRMSAAL
jgi:hypothetical protein